MSLTRFNTGILPGRLQNENTISILRLSRSENILGLMRSLLACALLALTSSNPLFAAKAYDAASVTIVDSWINQNNVRFIDASGVFQGKTLLFSFTCNAQDPVCSAPLVGQVYITSRSTGTYTCDEYKLDRSNEPRITVCLFSVE